MPTTPARPDLYGRTIHLAEPDYAFGMGLLLLRVERIAVGVQRMHGADWVEVHGVQVHHMPAGDVDGERRTVMVRLAALRKIPVRG